MKNTRGEEFVFFDLWKKIVEKKFIVLGITAIIVFGVLFVSLQMPKTFESKAVIFLGQVDDQFIVAPGSAKQLIQSAAISKPVFEEFYGNSNVSFQSFLQDTLEIEPIADKERPTDLTLITSIQITASSDDATKSRDIAQAISDSFLSYVNNKFSKRKDLLFEDYNRTVANLIKSHDNSTKNIIEEINLRKEDSKSLKTQISTIESQISSLQLGGMSNEGLSAAILLNSILDRYYSKVEEEQTMIAALREQLAAADDNFDTKMKDRKLSFEYALLRTKEFALNSFPEIPASYSSPNLVLNFAISLIVGLIISSFLVLLPKTR